MLLGTNFATLYYYLSMYFQNGRLNSCSCNKTICSKGTELSEHNTAHRYAYFPWWHSCIKRRMHPRVSWVDSIIGWIGFCLECISAWCLCLRKVVVPVCISNSANSEPLLKVCFMYWRTADQGTQICRGVGGRGGVGGGGAYSGGSWKNVFISTV